jgi:two-component system, cell cycle sensor histidine kinase and response regulator CckA
MISIILRKAGYTVHAAASPEAGIETAGSVARLDLLITDMVLPGMNGRRMAEIVQEKHVNIKTLFISGYTESVIVTGAANAAFLQKPFSPTGLTDKVREVLDGKGSA